MIKLVALDLDGTIVNENLEISERTMATLQNIRQHHGVKVVIATGRMFPSTIPFARRIGISDPVISYQGAMIRDISGTLDNILEHPILYHQGIDMEVSRAIVDYIHGNGYHTNIYINDQLYTTELNANSRYYQNISGVIPVEARNFHDILSGSPSKFMIIDDRADAILAELQGQFSAHASICKSRSNFVEVVHHSVSKWNAIQQLMERWHIQPEEVMAIGDQGNDLSMIEGAGVGVAMGQAPDNVKSRANYVTDSIDQDGAAKAIEKFVLGHMPLEDVPERV